MFNSFGALTVADPEIQEIGDYFQGKAFFKMLLCRGYVEHRRITSVFTSNFDLTIMHILQGEIKTQGKIQFSALKIIFIILIIIILIIQKF